MPQKIPGARGQRPRCHFLIVISPSRPTLRWHRGNQPLFLTTSKWELLAMSIWKTTLITDIASQGCGRVPSPLIGADFTARFHIFLQKAADGGGIGTLGHRQAQPPGFFHVAAMLVAIGDYFHRTKDQGAVFRRRHAPAPFASHRTSDEGLVGFDSSLQGTAGLVHHRLTQAMQQKPGGFVAATHLTRQLRCTQSRRVGGNQIGRPKPFPQRKATAMQQRACGGGTLIRTSLALSRPALFDEPRLFTATLGAMEAFRPATLPQVSQAGRLGGKLFSKLSQGFWKNWTSHLFSLPKSLPESTG